MRLDNDGSAAQLQSLLCWGCAVLCWAVLCCVVLCCAAVTAVLCSAAITAVLCCAAA